jgi:hypothetical protein
VSFPLKRSPLGNVKLSVLLLIFRRVADAFRFLLMLELSKFKDSSESSIDYISSREWFGLLFLFSLLLLQGVGLDTLYLCHLKFKLPHSFSQIVKLN